ncbi:hypothetical protein GQ42DRAFT_22510 [Ramicandelaber brevisporus]|nr:hypothetical protein GQ42DRAFT_22510 [Ramicandelaber brevisporus]
MDSVDKTNDTKRKRSDEADDSSNNADLQVATETAAAAAVVNADDRSAVADVDTAAGHATSPKSPKSPSSRRRRRASSVSSPTRRSSRLQQKSTEESETSAAITEPPAKRRAIHEESAVTKTNVEDAPAEAPSEPSVEQPPSTKTAAPVAAESNQETATDAATTAVTTAVTETKAKTTATDDGEVAGKSEKKFMEETSAKPKFTGFGGFSNGPSVITGERLDSAPSSKSIFGGFPSKATTTSTAAAATSGGIGGGIGGGSKFGTFGTFGSSGFGSFTGKASSTFGAPVSSFGKPAARSSKPAKNKTKATGEDGENDSDDDDEDEEDDDNDGGNEGDGNEADILDYRAPAADLMPSGPIEQSTGEENETTLCECTGKLYEVDTAHKSHKERGQGLFKINRLNSDNSKVRLIMRNSSTKRLILNANIPQNFFYRLEQTLYIRFNLLVRTPLEDSEEAKELDKPRPASYILRVANEAGALSIKNTLDDIHKTHSNGASGITA